MRMILQVETVWTTEKDGIILGRLAARYAGHVLRRQPGLQANGFSPSGQPDFLIAYYVTTKQGLNIQDNRFGIGPRDRWSNINVKQVTEGTLMVMFIDPATRQEVWVGMASGTINPKSLDKDVNKSITKLVQRFVKIKPGKNKE